MKEPKLELREGPMTPAQRDVAAVNQAVNFARRWACDWPTWIICAELIFTEWGIRD